MEGRGNGFCCKRLGLHHPKGLISSIRRLLSDTTAAACQSLPEQPHQTTPYFDVSLVCRDGAVPWSKFLLAANAPFLRESLGQPTTSGACNEFDTDAMSVILLPDMSTSTVSSMLKCTVNSAVRSDTLSVNEQEVMKLLGFELSHNRPLPSTSRTTRPIKSAMNQTSPQQEMLSRQQQPMQQQQEEQVNNYNNNQSVDDVDNNLDAISLLSGGLSIGGGSPSAATAAVAAVAVARAAAAVGDDDVAMTSSPLPPPVANDKSTPPPPLSSMDSSGGGRFFDERESVINTPTLSVGEIPDEEETDEDDHSSVLSDETDQNHSMMEPEKVGKIGGKFKKPATANSGGRDDLVCRHTGCGLKFQRLLHLKRHQSSHDPAANQMACTECGKVFFHPDNLKLHLKYHQDRAKQLECQECGEKLQGSRALKSHIERMHSAAISCADCGKQFHSKRLLKRHCVRMHTGDKAKTPANAKNDDVIGMKMMTNDDDVIDAEAVDSLVYCHICGKGFGNPQAMMVHKRTHSENSGDMISMSETGAGAMASKANKYVHCPECKKLFASEAHLSQHTRRTHQAQPKKCDRCDKAVKNLRKHQSTCHKMDDKSVPIQQHQPINCAEYKPVPPIQQQQPISCADCGLEFSSKYVLESHCKRVHLSQKEFKCEACGKPFVSRASLRRHEREVHGENSHECDECGLFFPVRHSLDRHVRHVHNPTRHNCPYCDTSVVHLSAHFVTAHKMSAEESRHLAEDLSGKSAARTDLPLAKIIDIKKGSASK